jgi:hypothetical protein
MCCPIGKRMLLVVQAGKYNVRCATNCIEKISSTEGRIGEKEDDFSSCDNEILG